MDLFPAWTPLGLLGLLAMAAGAFAFGWWRGPLIVLLGGLAVLATALALFLLYGGFAWSDRGGGVMLLFVIPVGLAAGLAWGGLMAVWASLPRRPADRARHAALAREALDDWQQDLQARTAALEARLARGWMLPGRRRRLERELREQRGLEAAMRDARQRADDAASGRP